MTVKDVQRRYDADAAAYSTWWAPVLRRAMEPVLDSIDWTGVSTTLEVGCGTGGVLDGMAARARRALTVGVDLTAAMLRLVPPGPSLAQADAQRLPLQDTTVDVAVTAFVLQHVERPDLALLELGRVVRPDGQLRVAAWGADASAWEGELIFHSELDAVGSPEWPTSRPGREATNTPDKLSDLALAAGFTDVAVTTSLLDWQPTADEVFSQLSTMRATGQRFAALTPDQAREVAHRVRARLDEADLRGWVSYEVLVLSGKRVNLRHN